MPGSGHNRRIPAMSSSSPAGPHGVNLVGYHNAVNGLGEAVRSIGASLRAAGVAVADVNVGPGAMAGETSSAPYPVTLAVLTAARMSDAAAAHPALFSPDRLRIGYWFWELSVVPADQEPAFAHIDRIWAPSEFVAKAYRSSGDTPVELHPIRMPEPAPSDATRSELGMPDGFTFLTSFDHFSVIERKNPTTVIAAFREAFPRRDDVFLVVKSINGDQRPASMRQVMDARDGDDRIVVIDRHIEAADQAAMIRHADCLVSLHRSEGLGLHLAEAMWLGTPVVATGYGGNVDFMDEHNSIVIDHNLVPVFNGEGAYPEGEVWAQPNILQATDALRRIESDPELRQRLASAGRAAMESQPTHAEVGSAMSAAISAVAKQLPIATTGGLGTRARSVARGATSPLRRYVNTHFEMTKDEVRAQVAMLAKRQDEALTSFAGYDRLADTIESLANTVAEIHVHQTRTSVDLRDEITDLRAEVAELRADLNVLTAALVRLAEHSPLTEPA